jgi:hypothetical protein
MLAEAKNDPYRQETQEPLRRHEPQPFDYQEDAQGELDALHDGSRGVFCHVTDPAR